MTKHEQSVHTFNTTPFQVTPNAPKWPHPLSLTSLCAHCVRYHKVRLSTVQSKAVCATQQVFSPEWSTVQTSMNTMVHRPVTQPSLISLSTHTHIGPSSTSTGTGGSAPPHMLSGSANDQEHVTLLTVPGTMHSHCIGSIP